MLGQGLNFLAGGINSALDAVGLGDSNVPSVPTDFDISGLIDLLDFHPLNYMVPKETWQHMVRRGGEERGGEGGRHP